MKMVAGEKPAGGREREVFRNFFDIFWRLCTSGRDVMGRILQ